MERYLNSCVSKIIYIPFDIVIRWLFNSIWLVSQCTGIAVRCDQGFNFQWHNLQTIPILTSWHIHITRRFSNHESRLLSRSHTFAIIVILDLKIHQSMWIHWPFFSKNLNQRSLTPRWPLTPCLLRSHVWLYPRIIVYKSHDNTSMYVDTVISFAKYHIHTHTTYILVLHTYYVQNEWSHSLLMNSVQARQKWVNSADSQYGAPPAARLKHAANHGESGQPKPV